MKKYKVVGTGQIIERDKFELPDFLIEIGLISELPEEKDLAEKIGEIHWNAKPEVFAKCAHDHYLTRFRAAIEKYKYSKTGMACLNHPESDLARFLEKEIFG